MPSVHRPSYYYDQIAEHYRQAIRSGELAPGESMPSVRTVKDEWRVTLKVAQRAMALLRDEGWTVTRHGMSTVVADHPPEGS